MKVYTRTKHILAALVTIIFIAGCYNDKADQLYPEPTTTGGGGNTCDTASISYATTIQPILTQYCALAGCHDATTPSFGYDFTAYAGAKLASDNARLLGAINQLSGYQPMPKNLTKLNECNINKITAWVNQGTLNN